MILKEKEKEKEKTQSNKWYNCKWYNRDTNLHI